MPAVRFQERDYRVEYDAFTTAELLGSQEGDDETQTDRSAGSDQPPVSEDDEQSLLSQLSTLQSVERARSVRFDKEQSDASEEPQCSRAVAAGVTSSSSPPRSPLLKKFAPVQDRRVNTLLLEALHLTDISRDEIGLIERSVKRLNDAILGFVLLVDKQVKIVGTPTPEERGRIKADIQDLSCQLKASNALIESTCARMKKHLVAGRNQISAHKRRLMTEQAEVDNSDGEISECTSPRCSINEQQQHYLYQPQLLHERQLPQCRPQTTGQTGIRFNRSPPRPTLAPNIPYGCRGLATRSGLSPTKSSPGKRRSSAPRTPRAAEVPLIWILKPRPTRDDDEADEDERAPTGIVSPDLFSSVLDAVGLQDEEFLEMRDLRTFLHGLLAFFIARNPALRFLDKAYHRRLMPEYVNELADALVMDMQLIPQLSGRSVIVTPTSTLEEYVCAEPFRFDRLLHRIHVNPSDGSVKDPSPNGYFTPPPFADAAAEAAATTFPTSPFKEQMTRNGGVMNGGKVVELVVAKPREPELIETAEQTLGMAKLLHELATAECEARNGNRMSIRASVPHAKEFSRAYIASSKELMLQETSFL
ncbi:hypothetical protein PF005_g3699 [Phytophthora fragariae]|uniref:Uncharacterized protein n=1 Tax=Phytophthora fragariae TaxID=53985 RepID=A0A6A4ACX6_9STRA|nr:hypothetical protein PF003_g38873 [Phytophthora fragariae]KAE8946400.1 hypothetical protein PF009_g3978 [Phytophthora fragariae]KAE9025566.1 hypothetical protein PF011_g2971 [Phytophthora fragariae]KAE9132304.1 hypothetical protein PF010_g3233 [Phytophthora fragariae]KAE9132656.1 hypothetical protein PF007_g3648 [Phytophthora fragariae]